MFLILTFALCFVLLPKTVASADEINSDQEVLQAVNMYMETVKNSYEGRYTPIDSEASSDFALMKQINGLNHYVSEQQKPYTIKESNFDFSVKESKVFENQAKVIVKSKLEQSLSIQDNTFPSTVEGKFAIELRKIDNHWKINRVIQQKGEGNEVFQTFKDQIGQQDNLIALSEDERKEQVIVDFSGINYLEVTGNNTETKNGIQVKWNDKKISFPDQQPIIKDGRTLVPIRPLVEELDGYGIVLMTPEPYTFSVLPLPNPNDPENINKKAFTFTIGDNKYAYTDPVLGINEGRELPMNLEVINGRTMLPVRTIGEAFGEVKWDKTTKVVDIRTFE